MASLKKRSQNTNKPWEVRWREGDSGRRKSFRRKANAQRWLLEALQIEEDERLGRFRPTTDALRRTLEDQWPHWQATRAHLAINTQKKDQWVWRRWLKPHLGRRMVGSIGYRDLNEVLAKVTQSGAGPDTRIAVYTRLNQILDDALGQGNHTCRQAVAGTSKRQREIRPLEDEELERLLEAAPAKWRLFIDVLATMGLRPHEACLLRGQDVLVGRGHSDRSINNAKVRVRTKKGRKEGSRILPLPSRLAAPLQTLATEAGKEAALFPVPDLRNWRHRVWNPLVEKSGMAGVVIYDLRHTCASKLVAKGATVTDVAQWLGTSPGLVVATYSHLFSGRLEELAAMLDR